MQFNPDAYEDAPHIRAEFAHELRNCLATMKSAVNLFDRSSGDGETFLKVKAALFREVDKMSMLIDQGMMDGAPDTSNGQGDSMDQALPADVERASWLPEDSHKLQLPGAKRVLVADDNQEALTGLAMMLRFEGYEVTTAQDGEEALSAAEEMHPDVVLLDIGMPLRDGFEVAREICTRSWSTNCKLIAVSGWGREEDKARAHGAGFHAHLIKPLDVDALMRLLATP